MSKKKILKQIEQLLSKEGELSFTQNHELPFEIGKPYFIRTVTYFATGRVKSIVGKFLVLEEAEGKMFINTDSITDAFPFNHKLPNEQK